MDSLRAVELKNSLATEFAIDLPSTITFDYPTINALAGYIAANQTSNLEVGFSTKHYLHFSTFIPHH